MRHGLRSHRLYFTWRNMMSRCHNESHKMYHYYGERGIKVCEEWHDISKFINDMYPTYIEGLTLDRINNDDGYYKDNCRWVNMKTQMNNRRELFKSNTTGTKHVIYVKSRNKWRVRLRCNSTRSGFLEGGEYRTKEEAERVALQLVTQKQLLDALKPQTKED